MEYKMSKYDTVMSKSCQNIDINTYVTMVREGFTQDIVLKIRTEQDKPKRQELKKLLPMVTGSCVMSGERKGDNIIEMNGLIVVDIDGVDIEEIKPLIEKDPYTFVSNVSASGNGICVFVKIDTKNFEGIFKGLEKYYLETYGIVIDKACKDKGRPRYISYDPTIFVNEKSKKFTTIFKEIDTKKHEKIIFVKSDFDVLINEINRNHINLTDGDYSKFLAIGFALAEEFGENGRDYFHIVASQDSKYNNRVAEKQYNACVRGKGSGVTIATFYHFCKEAGLKLYSTETKEIITQATRVKKAGGDKATVLEHLQKFTDVDLSVASPIVEQIFNSNFDFSKQVSNEDDRSETAQLVDFIIKQFKLSRNEITRRLENEKGKAMEDADLNSFYIDTKIALPFSFPKGDFDAVMFSRKIQHFNPILDFIKENEHRYNPANDLLKDLADCILARTEEERILNRLYLKKWFIGMIATTLKEDVSPLVAVLCGSKQGTGKTEFWRRLLPEKLSNLYAESKLDQGKDDEILMTQKILIMDDEFGGKSKESEKRFKELTSKNVFTLREPYGKMNVDLKRLATLCGTTNDNQVIADPTGNRRLLPIHVEYINHELYNSIDKTELFIQAYKEYKNGFDYKLLKEEIQKLDEVKGEFKAVNNLEELFLKYYAVELEENQQGYKIELSNTEILMNIQSFSQMRIGTSKNLGMILTNLGANQIVKKIGGKAVRLYSIYKLKDHFAQEFPTQFGYKEPTF